MIDALNTHTFPCTVRIMKGGPGTSVSVDIADNFRNNYMIMMIK